MGEMPATQNGYFDRLRRGDPPEQDGLAPAVGGGAHASEPVAVAEAAEPVPLDELAPHLPDPLRPCWWFSATRLPEKKMSAGRAVEGAAGARLPPEADYWCHAGDAEWVKVDRALFPKPAPKKKAKRQKSNRRHGDA